jgi:hypothetical protein
VIKMKQNNIFLNVVTQILLPSLAEGPGI